jgi:hypothetical protein
MPARSAGALGCRTHTGWAALVVIAGGLEQPEVIARTRAELSDPSGQVQKNVYQASRALKPADAAARIAAAERMAARQAAAELERTVRDTRHRGIVVQRCAVVTGAFPREARLESILASHALCHAAEGRLYQRALLEGAESRGLDAVAVPKRAIWDEAESTLGFTQDDLRRRIDDLRSRVGPPWAEDQKLAALAAWIVLAEPGAEV